MAKWLVHEYGEPKAEGRSFVVEAESKEEAIKKAPCQEWGATAELGCQNPKCDNYFWCGDEFCPHQPARD